MSTFGPKGRVEQSYSSGTLVRFVNRSIWHWKGAGNPPPMPYSATYATTQPHVGTLGANSTKVYAACFSKESRNALYPAREMALRVFYGKVVEHAGIGSTVAEGRESLGMIATRAIQMNRAWSACKVGNLALMATILGVKLKKRHRKMSKGWRPRGWARSGQAASVWMEYWMGWAPLVGSIFDAIEVLEKPLLPAFKHKGGGSRPFSFSGRNGSGNSIEIWDVSGVSSVVFHATLTPINSNAAAASRLGLTNPYLIAWDLVPFSFLVNWFIPVDSFLSSFSFHHQFQMADLCETTRVVTKGSDFATLYGNTRWKNTSSVFYTARVLPQSLPNPSPLDFSNGLNLSYSRAATAVSLLISNLTRP